ncbi:MAG: sulfotransferase [Halioglobus sp.]
MSSSDYTIDGKDKSPIVIGGLGGSGTRLVTSLVQDMGVSMGGQLNGTLDNLWFSLLFVRRSILLKPEKEIDKLIWLFTNAMRHGERVPKHLRKLVIEAARFGRDPVLPLEVLKGAYESMLMTSPSESVSRYWGWKQPNTHVMVGMLNRYYPSMKYIYVARNGLDMAFSENQNQFRYFWGDLLLEGDTSRSPTNALRYWVASYKRLLDEASKLGDRIHILNYDRLCREPLLQLKQLKSFVGIDVDPVYLSELAATIKAPETLGRYREHDCSQFDSEDIEFVRQMGFTID